MSARISPMVKLDADGVLERAWLPSKTVEGVTYEMARTASGWAHTSTDCRGWVEQGNCYHVAALEGLMSEEEQEQRSITLAVNPLALLDAVQLDQVMNEKLIPSAKHIYDFQVKGQRVVGVSIDGVRDAARALSTKGEAIREQWVRLEREDDRDAYFIACAGRYAVAPDGREICMDTAIRAKRQPKYMKLRDGGEQFNESWYEIGVAKAVRNATEALLPEALKDFIKERAKELASGKVAPAKPPASFEAANKWLREMKETADESWFQDLLVLVNGEFSGCVTRGGQLMATAYAESDAIWAWLKTNYVQEPPPPA